MARTTSECTASRQNAKGTLGLRTRVPCVSLRTTRPGECALRVCLAQTTRTTFTRSPRTRLSPATRNTFTPRLSSSRGSTPQRRWTR
eukprot:859470-Alexandrium_andersonii.AAC.1